MPSRSRIGAFVLAAALAAVFALPPAAGQTAPPASGRGQSSGTARPAAPARGAKPPAPQTQGAKPQPAAGRGAAPAPAPAAAAAPEPPPAPAPPPDLRYKTIYTTGNQKTESVTLQKGPRQRFEFADTVLLKQGDLKRTVQVSRAANTYLVVPDAPPPAAPAPGAAPAGGIVTVSSTFEDTGERRTVFGLEARRVRTTIIREPMPGACDSTRQRIETDAWYVDLPIRVQPAPAAAAATPASTCADQIRATQTGDPKVLGFPVSYAMTMTAGDEPPNVVRMEITELELTTLDQSLFEIPADMTEAGDARALSRALSDAGEAKLAADLTLAPPAPKVPGTLRIGVPEPINKTSEPVDTRLLRARLVAELAAATIDAEPLPAGSQEELLARGRERGHGYVLLAEVTDLKVSKPGRLGGLLKAASSVAGGGATRDSTSANLSIKLLQPDGRTKHSSNAKGEDGGFDMKAGLGLARFAGAMYMNVMTGRLMMNALTSSTAGDLQGLGMLGNPAMFGTQSQAFGFGSGAISPGMPGLVPPIDAGSGAPAMNMGLDPTAGAASFLMFQAMSFESANDADSGRPSFDAALDEALKNAAKSVVDNLKR